MDVLIIGNGAREHAWGWSLRQDPGVQRLYASPGNAGLAEIAECVAGLDTAAKAAAFAREHDTLVVIGPEAPLAAGWADVMRQQGVLVVGPSRAAARIESSKAFAKELMGRAGIPTAGAIPVATVIEAETALRTHFRGGPVVVKADGLAQGKGVVVARHSGEAMPFIRDLLERRRLGDAGRVVLLEEQLMGPEMSLMAVTDGQRFHWLPPSRDYKRLGDGDDGPNTGGMGALAPHPAWNEALAEEARRRIFEPLLEALAEDGTPFQGVLYAGLMLTAEGPKVLEWNARLGDPEAAVTLPLLTANILPYLEGMATGHLPEQALTWKGVAVGVVMAAPGYPEHPVKEIPCEVHPVPGALIFHAATERGADGLKNHGGRTFCVVGRGRTWAEARDLAYSQVRAISFPGSLVRTDIAASDSLT